MCDQRIYVACLASYNAGVLHGRWIDVSTDTDEVLNEINDILKDSKEPDAEEWAIHDSEGFEGLNVSENHSIDELCEYVETLEGCNHDIELVCGVMDNLGCTMKEAIDYVDDHYCGEYDKLEDWAHEFLSDCGYLDKLPDNLKYYFDYEAYARDSDLMTVETNTGVHVLWNA